jgi:hypothetical protein
VEDFAGDAPQYDDATVLVLRWRGRDERPGSVLK